ncbi:MAG: FtsX-like permease family protein [Reichenbachiella sp.]|uniref:ABC transporter permease n=1 Tax=Reichenbachiella sp. TaxID=2184521 RepID=UPI0032668EFD
MMYLKLAWRNIWRNKRRTFITMASIVFAVLLAILLNSVKEGVLIKMQENVVSFYTGAVQLHKAGYWDEKTLDNSMTYSDSLVAQVVNHPDVDAAIGRLESYALAASEKYTKVCMVVGIEPENETLVTSLDEKIVAGDYILSDDKGVLVSEGLAEYLKLTVGDTLVIIGQGYHGVSAAGKFPIRGLIRFASPQLNRTMVYLPMTLAQQLFGAPDRITALVLNVDDVSDADRIERELSSEVGAHYEVMGWKVLLPELNQVLEGERAENVIFLFVLYMLIAFGIFGTVIMMTIERQYEFGVLVAIGMRNLKLSGVVVMENIMISVMGAILGTLISIPVVGYFYKFPIRISGDLQKAYENFGFEPIFYFSIAPKIFYSQTVVIFCVALVLSLYPLLKITRLKPVNAMRT